MLSALACGARGPTRSPLRFFLSVHASWASLAGTMIKQCTVLRIGTLTGEPYAGKHFLGRSEIPLFRQNHSWSIWQNWRLAGNCRKKERLLRLDVHLEQGPRPCMCAKTYFCIVHFKLAPTLRKICDNIQLDNDKILKMQYLIIIFGTNSIPLVFTQCPKERLSGISFSDDTYL